jgi:hypothetical protein
MLAALDWTSQEFYHYLAIACGVAVAVSIAVYAVPGGKLKVPGIALSIVASLGLGLALGIIIMGAAGYELKKTEPEGTAGPPGGMPPMGGGMQAMPMGGMMGGGGGGGRGGRGGGGGGPNYKQQLANLVVKLDVLTEKPLTVKLNDEQRKEVNEQLKGLADAEELSDEDAKAKFEKLHEVLKDQTDTLEAAGYRWPQEGGGRGGGFGGGGGGGRGGRGGAEPPKNPFTTEQNGNHLKSLTERLNKT